MFKQSIFRFFREHWQALFFACLVGWLTVAPSVSAPLKIGEAYKGVPFFYVDDEDYYLARMQEIVDGHWPVGSPFFYEYKNTQPLQPATGEYVFYVLPAKVFQISLQQFLVVSKFIYPALLFLLVYCLVLLMMREAESRSGKLTSITAGLLVTLGYQFVAFDTAVSFFQGKEIAMDSSVWTRPVNPITGGILLFLFLIFAWKLLTDSRRFLWIPAGLVLGLMHFYFFSWGVGLSIVAVLALFHLLKKDFGKIKKLMLVVLVSLLVSAPFWLSLAQSFSEGGGDGVAKRQGMMFTHSPLLNKVLLASLALFIIFSIIEIYKKRNFRELTESSLWSFCLSLLLAGLWALNQHIVSGRTIWPYHFVQYTKPLAIVVLVVSGSYLIQPLANRLWSAVLFVLIASSLANGVILASSYRFDLDKYRLWQKEADLYGWLNTQATKDCVVLNKENVEWRSLWIPAFTHCNVYLSSYIHSGIPSERATHNFFVWLRMNGVSNESVEGFLESHEDELRSAFYDDFFTLFSLKNGSWFTKVRHDKWFNETKKQVAGDYKDFLEKDFSEELRKYRLDYLVSQTPLSDDEKVLYKVRDDKGLIGQAYLYGF